MKKLMLILLALLLALGLVCCGEAPAPEPEGPDTETEEPAAPEEEKTPDEEADEAAKKAEEEKAAAEKKKAEEEKAAAEKKAEEERAAQEKKNAEEEIRKAEEEKKAQEEKAAAAKAEKERLAAIEPEIDKVNRLEGDALLIRTIDNSFTVQDKHICVECRVENGSLEMHDAVKVYYDLSSNHYRVAEVTGIQMSRKDLDRAEAGDVVTLRLGGLNPKEIRILPGAALVDTDSPFVPSTAYNGTFDIDSDATPKVKYPTTMYQIQVTDGYSYECHVENNFADLEPGGSFPVNLIFRSNAPILYRGQTMNVLYNGRKCGTFTVDIVWGPDWKP